jgi:energy-coupling factor transporter ATP-binding protein EcfA2
MIIDLRNLGMIREATIDLKPLTVFIGPNNSGKTWIAYTLAAILGPFGYTRYLRMYSAQPDSTGGYPPLDEAIQSLFAKGNAKIDLLQFATEYAEHYFNNIAHSAREWMATFMGTEQVSFDTLEVTIQFAETKERFLAAVQDTAIERKLSVGHRDEAMLRALKERGEAVMYFYTATDGDILDDLPKRAIREFLAENVFVLFHMALYPYIYMFPTERTTFINYPPAIVEMDEEANKKLMSGEKFTPMAAPVSRFLQFMHVAFDRTLSGRNKAAKQRPAIARYLELATLLEQEILGGQVDFSTTEPEPGRELLFQAKGVTLDMPVVSSMVKELTPLVLYLRYLAQPGELLIIDEPEMNLHPAAQAQFTEFLALMVQAGLHLVITTHSPYVIDHLGNLMAAASHSDSESLRETFFLKRTEAFLSSEHVSAYLVENQTAVSAMDEEKIIDWGTFGAISERLMHIYAAL